MLSDEKDPAFVADITSQIIAMSDIQKAELLFSTVLERNKALNTVSELSANNLTCEEALIATENLACKLHFLSDPTIHDATSDHFKKVLQKK